MRIGIGSDIHRLQFGKKMVLGGVEVPSPKGPIAHSDGDTLTHVVIDAIFGAAAIGDIGHHFLDSDAQYKGISSIELLARALKLVHGMGLEVANVDVTVILETPKLGRLKTEIAANLAKALGIPPVNVNVKARTNEGLDAIGQGNAIGAEAVVLLKPAENQPKSKHTVRMVI
ncbi:MAG: 2-C-methyl-D-erythritol 2,4-cyclodiphosphate synthase [Planctomycetota bacterium]